MSAETNPTTTEATPMTQTAAPKAKKASKPKAKSVPKATAAPSTNGKREKKDGLRPMQIRVLKLLSKSKHGLTRTAMYEKLEFTQNSGLNDVLGKNDPAIRAKTDKAKYPSLLSLKYIRLNPTDVDGKVENLYQITASGKAALTKAE